MLPWGTDQTWDEHLDFDGAGGVLFDECLADSGCCRALYRCAADGSAARRGLADLDAAQHDGALAARRCCPWQQLERATVATRDHALPYDAAEIDAERVARDRRIHRRRAGRPSSRAWLGGAGRRPCTTARNASRPPVTPPHARRRRTDRQLRPSARQDTTPRRPRRPSTRRPRSGSVDAAAGIGLRFGRGRRRLPRPGRTPGRGPAFTRRAAGRPLARAGCSRSHAASSPWPPCPPPSSGAGSGLDLRASRAAARPPHAAGSDARSVRAVAADPPRRPAGLVELRRCRRRTRSSS